MEETCQKCGKAISRRARANIWNGTQIVCTPCLKDLQAAQQRADAAIRMAGRPGSAWMVHDGHHQRGPFPTPQLIALLGNGKISWESKIWRDGMAGWQPLPTLFVPAELGHGRIELRDFGQGDGTYRPGRN